MRSFRPRCHHQFARTGLVLVILALWGCSGAPVQEEKPEGVPPPPVEQPPPVDRNAVLVLPASQYSSRFRAAETLLADYRWMEASEVLATLGPDGLTEDDRIYLDYLQARIDYVRGEQERSQALLLRLDHPQINPALQYRILNFRRYMAEMSGEYLDSAQLGDQLLQLAPRADIPALKRAIWRDLQSLNSSDLEQARFAGGSEQFQGWLELALLSRNTLVQLPGDLTLWLQNNPRHPAADGLPGGLAYLVDQPQAPARVALLLPLSGRLAPAGRAVQDGYLASYYAARLAGEANHEIMVVDMDVHPSASSAYDNAVARGANLVLGPLSKQSVAELNNHPDRPVPVLALNRHEEEGTVFTGSSALVQLALAPEDEARTIAGLAYGQGARRALIIRPEGEWGSKVAQALIERWQELGGSFADSVTYRDRSDYSADIKQALGIPASEQRARDIRDLFATNVEFNARRRQDIDAIFLLSANGSEARSLKPLLAFHYAGGLPVYSTSSIYGGNPDPRDRDLDGIHFVEIPWLLGAAPDLRVAIAAGDTGSDAYTRLNALGADAFLLQARFQQLQAGADALLRGNTGLLSMDPQLRIRREPSPATFDGGRIESQ